MPDDATELDATERLARFAENLKTLMVERFQQPAREVKALPPVSEDFLRIYDLWRQALRRGITPAPEIEGYLRWYVQHYQTQLEVVAKHNEDVFLQGPFILGIAIGNAPLLAQALDIPWSDLETSFRKRYPVWDSEPVGPDYTMMIRATAADLSSPVFHGLKFPERGYVECVQFGPDTGAGIYGLLDGVGDWGLIPQDRTPPPVWQVLKVKRSECIRSDHHATHLRPEDNFGSVRVPRAWVVYTGTAGRAVSIIWPYMVRAIREGADCTQAYKALPLQLEHQGDRLFSAAQSPGETAPGIPDPPYVATLLKKYDTAVDSVFEDHGATEVRTELQAQLEAIKRGSKLPNYADTLDRAQTPTRKISEATAKAQEMARAINDPAQIAEHAGLSVEEVWAEYRTRYAPWESEPAGPEYGYMIRSTASDLTSPKHPGGFRFPAKGYVECLNFSGKPYATTGIYGLLDGVGDWGLIPLERDPPPVWQVLKVKRSECVRSNYSEADDPLQDDESGAVRVPRAWVVYTGTAGRAISIMWPHLTRAIRGGANCRQVYKALPRQFAEQRELFRVRS